MRQGLFVALVLVACGEETAPPSAAGEACQYIGTVVGNDTEQNPASQDQCHYIGTLNPLTGPLGAVGLPLQNAARLAVRDINQAGPVAGKQLCLVACDTRTDPTTVQATVESMVAEFKIKALNGAAASSASIQAAIATREANIPQISCCSTSPVLSSSSTPSSPNTGYENVFRTVPSDALQGLVLANVARQLPEPADRVAVMFVNDTYGESLKDVYATAFAGVGGTITRAVPYNPGAASYNDVIEAAFEEIPDHALLIAFPTDGAQILRDWRTSGLARDVQWLATDGLKDDKFVQGAGAGTAATVIGTAPVLRGKHFDSFRGRYEAEYGGAAPGIFTSNQYDAVVLIALGLARQASSGQTLHQAIRDVAQAQPGDLLVSPDNLVNAIQLASQGGSAIDYSGASGEVDIDAVGDVLSDYGVWDVRGAATHDLDACWRCARNPDRCEANCPAN